MTVVERKTNFTVTECFDPNNPKVIVDGNMPRAEYVDCYLKPFIKYFQSVGDGFVTQKILAQLQLQESGLGDPDTWLILPEDRRSLANLVRFYHGRPMWISTAVDADFSDPAAIQRATSRGIKPVKTFLYRGPKKTEGITQVSELDEFYDALKKYQSNNPRIVIQALKTFPQDLPKSAVARAVFHPRGISFRQNIKTFNAREDENRAKFVDLDIVWLFADMGPVIIADKPNDARYLTSFVNSPEVWQQFERLMANHYPDVNPVAPEFMVANPGEPNAKVMFFSDINASSQPGSFPQSPLLSSQTLAKLNGAPIINRNQSDLLTAIDTISNQLPETADRWGIHPADTLKITDAVQTLLPHLPTWTQPAVVSWLAHSSSRRLTQIQADLHSVFSDQPKFTVDSL